MKFARMLGTFCLVFLLPSLAGAYSFTSDFTDGSHWDSFPIKLQVVGQDSEEAELVQGLVERAVDEWHSGIGSQYGDIWSVASSYKIASSGSGNVIRFSYNFEEETGYASSTTLGIAIRYAEFPYFVKTQIILNGDKLSLRQNQGDLLYKVLLHEIGHTIGLDHSEFGDSIMYAQITSVDVLSADDIEGAQAALDDHFERQDLYVGRSALTSDSNSSQLTMGTCGTISTNSGSGGGGGSSFLGSLLVGLLMAGLFCRPRRIKALS